MKNKKVILVTGASSGLGRAMAKALAGQGHRVYGTSRDLMRITGEGVSGIQLDVTDEASVRKAVAAVIAEAGRIDVLINNAGITLAGPLYDMPVAAAVKQFDTNVFAVVRLCSAVLPLMIANNEGLIINIGSLAGLFGLPYQGLYSASKFALEGYTQSLRMELKHTGIKVTIVNAGDFRTAITANREKIKTTCPAAHLKQEYAAALAVMEKDESLGSDPELLAKLICKIVDTATPANRYLCGATAQRLVFTLKKMLPASVFENLLSRHYGIR